MAAVVYNEVLQKEYLTLWRTMKIRPERLSEIDYAVRRIERGKTIYKNLEKKTGVPWFFIGLLHMMESGNDFTRHLHNGDLLSDYTRNVPALRPKVGHGPPFTFEESAIDALSYMKFDQVKDWPIFQILYLAEKFNGWGYRTLSVPINSPYLWSFTNLYTAGKYVSDGKYSATAISLQPGIAPVLFRLLQRASELGRVNPGPSWPSLAAFFGALLFFHK